MRLIAENLSAHRGEDLIFSNISFNLTAGEALLLTGRNGSGKSTLLKVVAGLIRPASGAISWQGGRGETGVPVREVCHYLGHRNAMKPELSVAENLAFWRAFLGDRPGGAGLSVGEAAAAVELEAILHLPFGYLSAGQQRRMAFAKLLVAHRPVWLLDEPTAALDSAAEGLFASLIRDHLGRGGLVLAATHQPLDLVAAHRLQMQGFQYAQMEGEIA
ncbi:heme ABC exporter ATP-binding protein CcmA [Rhizobium sp. CSW-27]|uniref:heme ABC exporter ATP-binding protein CcmA n=1 Tax=Rhizobium sp. CSW-27 TaxID=2839985 RepID=UPI001C036465|nr:heme ABC exporter ATP-binding protein CcmA [Rhizobium sp. CSW-27]MBT9370651.1 heme ABC exporter ATP-binding protein CcmA [Rhizobium sp. CSW-27]